MRYEEFKNLVVQAAEKAGLTDYELYYSASESTEIETFRQEVDKFSSSAEGGVCFRALVNGQMGYASTEDLSEEEAEERGGAGERGRAVPGRSRRRV